MISSPSVSDMGTFAMRAVERAGPNEWMVLIVPANTALDVAEQLRAEIEALGESSLLLQINNPQEFANRAAKTPGGILILAGVDKFAADDWCYLDHERSLLERPSTTVIVAELRSFELLSHQAPNFASWVGGDVWRLQDSEYALSEEAREARLQELRTWSNKSDNEVVALAEQGRLDGEPSYVEWLILLNRGDLLGK